MLIFIKYFMLYAIFIIAATLLTKRDKTLNVKAIFISCLIAILSTFLIAFLLPYLEQILMYVVDGTPLFIGWLIFDRLISLVISIVTILGISFTFRLGVKPTLWIYVIIVVITLIAIFFDILNIKEQQAFFNNYTLTAEYSNFLDFACFTPKFQKIVSILTYLPSMILGSFLLIKKADKKHECSSELSSKK